MIGGLTLETERLILRPWEPADLPVLSAFALDPVLMHHFGRVPLVDDSRERLERMARFDRELGYSFKAVVRRTDGAIIGNCGLKPNTLAADVLPHARPDDVEIGWLFRTDAQGQGYALEAASAVMDWGLRLAPRVIAITAFSNVASQRLMQKLGMRHLPDWDFEHPDVPVGHFARHSLAYARDR